jgi:hypothetical protein
MLEENYHGYGDYIKMKYLNFRESRDDNCLLKALPSPITYEYAFVQNKYPYALRKPIRHYLIWSAVPLQPSRVEEIINTHRATEKFRKYVWFVNDVVAMSVPEVWHCHVFVK